MSRSIDISETHKEIVQAILREHLTTSCHVWVFGSRATWLAKEYSDLDLAIARKDGTPLSLTVMSAIETAFEDSLLPWKVDVIDLHSVSAEFRTAIERDKVLFSLGVGGEWRSISLKDAAKWLSGGTPPKDNTDYWGGSIPWISAKSMKGNRFSDSELKLTEAGLKKGSRLAPKNATLLLVRGSMLHQRVPIGITTEKVAFNQDVKAIIPINDFLPLYFFYSLASREQELLNKVENTGIGAGKLDTDVLYKMEIACPPIDQQKAIAHILGTLDDKIELNRQTNQTLEAMAQALFQSWFVDFDPVIDKALAAGNEIPEAFQAKAAARQALGDQRQALPEEVTALFPDAFVFTEEMGWVPEGWEISTLESIISEVIDNRGKTPPLASSESYIYPLVEVNSLNDGNRFFDNYSIKKHVNKNTYDNWFRKGHPKKGDVLISTVGSIGKVCLVDDEQCCIAQNIIALRGRSKDYGYYLYELLKYQKEKLINLDISSVQPSIKVPHLMKMKILDGHHLHKKFANIVYIYSEKYKKNQTQTGYLASIRDTLLPKLISGELRVADAGGFLGEVGI